MLTKVLDEDAIVSLPCTCLAKDERWYGHLHTWLATLGKSFVLRTGTTSCCARAHVWVFKIFHTKMYPVQISRLFFFNNRCHGFGATPDPPPSCSAHVTSQSSIIQGFVPPCTPLVSPHQVRQNPAAQAHTQAEPLVAHWERRSCPCRQNHTLDPAHTPRPFLLLASWPLPGSSPPHWQRSLHQCKQVAGVKSVCCSESVDETMQGCV